MKVTIRIDDELRKKPYWRNISDTDEFEYVKDRAPSGAVLIDRQKRTVFCAKDRLVFPGDGKIEPVIPPVIPTVVQEQSVVVAIDGNETKD